MTSAKSKAPGVTPSQTIGPFFHEALAWACTPVAPDGDDVRVEGVVVDGNGQPVDDALLEIWQPADGAEHDGRVAAGFQRVATDAAGRFAFTVRKDPASAAVAHITVFARGLLRGLRTRVYVGAAPDKVVELDELVKVDGLRDVPASALATLVAVARDGVYRWDVRLQGDGETLFFELL